MSDEFPTLEVAAALGLVALATRAVLLAREKSSIRRDNRNLVDALESGAHARAVELCARSESPAYADLARRVLGVIEERGQDLTTEQFREQVHHAAEAGVARARRRSQKGRARDLIALAVLIGALAYGLGGNLNASPWFLLLVSAACAILIASFVLRGRITAEIRTALSGLIAAAATSKATALDALSDRRCRACGSATQIVVQRPEALGPAPWGLDVEELRICRSCGRLRGRIKDPGSIPIGPSHGTVLTEALDPGGVEIASNPREHEG